MEPAPVTLSKVFSVKLLQLQFKEDENVRTSPVSEEGIEQMASMLLSQGQFNPLVVSKSEDDHYVVHAGGRRLRGFWLLQKQGHIDADFLVDVREVDASNGIDASLVENFSQEPMHPADEYIAFERLAKKGQTPEQIAKAFGCKVLHVIRRLKLAALHPELMAQFRDGEITLDQVMALASCDDPERQLLVWESLPAYHRNETTIRRKLTEEEVSADDDRVKLITLEAYLSHGGTLRQDLFSEEGKDQYLTDPALVDLLVGEALEAYAETVRSDGWAFVDVLDSYGYEVSQAYHAQPVDLLPESEDQTSRRVALEAQIEKLEELADMLEDSEEAGDDEKAEKAREEVEQLQEQIDRIEDERIDNSSVDKSVLGAIVYPDDGQIVCKTALLRASDAAILKAKRKAAQSLQDSSEDSAQANTSTKPLSERLMLDLTAHKTAALQALVCKNQDVALALLASAMALREFGDRISSNNPMKISMSYQWHALEKASPTMVDSQAYKALLDIKASWVSRLPEHDEEFFAWFLAQGASVSTEMIVFCSALTLDAVKGQPTPAKDIDQIAQSVQLDMRQWWDPSKASYLDFVPKAKVIEAVIQATGEASANGMDKMKKPDLLAHAERALKGSGWLPEVLR